ncbi:MAG: diguanylate cyclase response regulator [Geobacteraceae bacterium GWC2_58_44]|nr:MAG: diguanylate cyclase response regulator [Geobacteraceae bacterium GWC2_58_44]
MRILMAEDDPDFRRLLEDMLVRWGYQVVIARDGEEAWQLLQAGDAPQLAIFDWMMPGMDGVEICRKMRQQIDRPYTYILLLTSQQREEDLVTGMDAGADDYVTKPFKHNELRVRLRAGRRIIELQNELVATREILQHRASHDSLTGLWNHGEILGILRQELARVKRRGDYMSVIMADLDNFKRINDSYGHMVGDEVLRSTVQRMQTLVRSYDSIGRYGGEEFLFVLPECCVECCATLAERVRLSICSDDIDSSEGKIAVTISLGVASSGKRGGWDEEELIKAADAALYRAKEKGRNRVEMALE